MKKIKNSANSNSEMSVPRMFLSFENAGYYMISGEIDIDITTDCIKYIIERNVNFEEYANETEIRLIINSGGGDLCSAFALIDIMKGSRIPISTFGIGTIASAALSIFMAGTKGKRFITNNTSILSHQFSWGSFGKEHELYAQSKEFELTTSRMLAHYKKCTGMNDKKVRETLLPANDVWLSSEEAVKYGIADKIITWY
jgi:ATP-dependent Clp endopeptidase proteolytic subunit ClpP